MGVICQPGTFSSLEIGYAYIPDGGGRTVPVTEVDLPLWAFGEKTGEDPMDYSFRFKAEGVWHEVMVSLYIPHALVLSEDCREPRVSTLTSLQRAVSLARSRSLVSAAADYWS